MPRLVRDLLLVVMSLSLLAPFVAPVRADELKADLSLGKKLLIQGNELADKGQTTEAQVRYQEAYQQILPGLRKLPFKHEVKRDVTAREELKDYLIKDLDADMSPEEFRASELGLKALGFLPPETNWKETVVRVYAAEIAAFYDPRTKTMHLIKEPEAKAPPSFLDRLLGKTGGFDKDETQTVIAHELTHALADQHFDLQAMHEAVKDDDDLDLALSALMEGEATLTMMGVQMKDWDGSVTRELAAEDLDRTFSIVGAFLPMFGGKDLRGAPPILRESMMFPYIKGMVFCTKLVNTSGWAGIDEAYKSPPLSTEQVLHLDKYRVNPDPPMAIDLGHLDAGEGWKQQGQNVVGELQLGILLKGYGGRKASAGWDGDRYAVFEGPEGKLGLIWFSVWDSEDDAREFTESYVRFQTTKLGPDAVVPEEIPDRIRRRRGEAIFTVVRRGSEVAVVEGFDRERTGSLVRAAFASKKTEKTWKPKSSKVEAGNR